MGKKGSWFSAIKRVFTPHSKEKLAHDSEKKSKKAEKKKGVAKSRHGGVGGGESNSLIPLFREPSSIEKIFRDFEREQQRIEYGSVVPTPTEWPTTPPFVPAPPRASSPRALMPRGSSPPRVALPPPTPPPPRAASPRASSPRVAQQRRKEINYRPEPTLRNHHASATRIQAAYRGYVARRSVRALKGLVRLQGVVRGQNVKRQTVNAMKQMQLLVRIQSQIQSRRIQMLENQARSQRNDKDVGSAFGKWTPSQVSEAGNNEDWDDSVLTKEEIEGRLQRKMEAEIKRERAMAYAHSHQFGKGTPKSVQAALTEFRSGGFPRWWNWLEHQPPASNPPQKAQIQTLNNFLLAPPTPQSEPRRTPRFFHSSNNNQKQNHFSNYNNNLENLTPKSTRSTIVTSTRPFAATPPSMRTPPANGTSFSRYNRPRTGGFDSPFDLPLKDNDSLTSCPPFSAPRYMTPTVSAKAKVRAESNPKERIPSTPSSEMKRRLSFPLTQGFASFKWNKGSVFSNKDSSSQRILDKNQSLQSIGNMSVDSTVSLPAGVGRKPFNRFV